MFRIFNVWEGVADRGVSAGPTLAFAGAVCLLTAFMIFAFPELVAYLVATVLLGIGGAALVLAFRLRQSVRHESGGQYYEII